MGEAQPVDWLRDFTEPENTPPTEDLVGSSQPEGLKEHQDVVCGVVSSNGSKGLTGRQGSLLQQLTDDGPPSIDGGACKEAAAGTDFGI